MTKKLLYWKTPLEVLTIPAQCKEVPEVEIFLDPLKGQKNVYIRCDSEYLLLDPFPLPVASSLNGETSVYPTPPHSYS